MANEKWLIDVVSIGVHDQVRWERDVAMQQLEEHGIPFGGIAPDVVKVVRCKDCKYLKKGYQCYNPLGCGLYDNDYVIVDSDDFCSYGERKDNEKQTD